MALRSRYKYFMQNSNLHGVRHIVDEKPHTITKLIWFALLIFCYYAMVKMFKASFDSFEHNSISFATETTYLNWNTTFPAISICEIASTQAFSTGDEDANMQQFLFDLTFFTGSCYTCNPSCESCLRVNYPETVKRYRKECRRLIGECRWRNTLFDCCDHFLPLNTEYGICFTINSMHTQYRSRKTLRPALDMRSNQILGPGELIINAQDDVRLYIHSPEDVPFINSDTELRKEIILGETHSIDFNVIEISNDENVKSVRVDKRGCRFPEEVYQQLQVYHLYSYSTCVVQCHADAHLTLCNCTHHLMPILGKENYCDMEGLMCLTKYFETVNRLHARGFDKPGLVCECVPSCNEPEYNIVSEHKQIKSFAKSEIIIRMQNLPTLRFKRNVVRTAMDLVVSIGGIAGLFIGASLLSIIEFVYLILLRRAN